MITLPQFFTTKETAFLLADRFKSLRLAAGYKRSSLASKAGVSEASLKRFESTGQVSLKNLLRLAHALDRLQEFTELFTPAPAATLDQLRQQTAGKTRKRGVR
jgi:transcriptional regulator with XRE-family HTH domain